MPNRSPSSNLIQGSRHRDRYGIWRRDLESIRRAQPVLDPSANPIVTVTSTPPRVQAPQTAAPATPQTAAPATPGNVVVIDSDSDDDHQHNLPSPPGSGASRRNFYGLTGVPSAQANADMRFQDVRLADAGLYPSPQDGLGFDMAQLSRATGDRSVRTFQDVQAIWNQARLGPGGLAVSGFDDAVTNTWATDTQQGMASLLQGFPLVESVVFFRAMNYRGAQSSCLFKAVSYLVYGDNSLYARVQAEHWQHYSDVLNSSQHPRHQVYVTMNQRFYRTQVSAGRRPVRLQANFFQLLSIPHLWLPLDLLDITADLYNLFIVVYTIQSQANNQFQVTGVTVKGSYNARHVFLLFTGNHFQPMVPNDFLASEFTFPRPTSQNVQGLTSSSNADSLRASVALTWRNTWRGLDKRQGSLPVDHAFDRDVLRTVVTGTYP